MNIGAIKFDKGLEKLPWDLLPFEAVEGTLRVLKYGERKYTICGDCSGKIYKNPRLVDGDPYREDCPDCGSRNIITGAHNWRKGFKWSRLVAAAFRHLVSVAKGDMVDQESGELHVHHLSCMTLFMGEHITSGLGENDLYNGKGSMEKEGTKEDSLGTISITYL
jgi:hypothetical protein